MANRVRAAIERAGSVGDIDFLSRTSSLSGRHLTRIMDGVTLLQRGGHPP